MQQGSILGPHQFVIIIIDLFLYVEKSNLCNFADDSTPYTANKSLSVLTDNLKKDTLKMFNWYHDNYMALIPDKSHFMILGCDKQTFGPICQENKITYSQEQKVGVTIASKTNFASQVTKLTKKVSEKLPSLAKVKYYMDIGKNKLLFPSFVKSQIDYCPLFYNHEQNI